MGRGKVAAQAQVQHHVTISHTESLELVRCLLRVLVSLFEELHWHDPGTMWVGRDVHKFTQIRTVEGKSIFHVSYLRGLFPEKSFKGVDMKNLDDMHIKMLLPACEESRRLIDWVEGGVYDSIKRGYLKNLFFGISTDPEGTQLLEEYIFLFKYDEGKVAMDINARTAEGGKKGGKKREFKQETKADLNTVRYQVCRLIRMLVQVCRTLDKVPAERFLFMKLTYQDHTPDEYEPPYFIPVDESGIGHFKRAPFSMAVGRVATDHHTVSLKVKSTLDSCDDDLMDEEAAVGGESGAADGPRSGSGGSHDIHSRPGMKNRVTAHAQPSEGSVGSGEAGTAAATDVAEGANEELTGGRAGGDVSVDVTEAGAQVDAMDGVEEGEAGTPLRVEGTAVPLLTPEAIDVFIPAPHSREVGAVNTEREQLQPQLLPRTAAAKCGDKSAMEVDGCGVGEPLGAGAESGTAATEAIDAAAGGGDGEDDVTEAPEAEDYVALCEFVRGRAQVNLQQLERQFPSMPHGELAGYINRLSDEGVLMPVVAARNRYRVVPLPPLPTAAAAQAPENEECGGGASKAHVVAQRRPEERQGKAVEDPTAMIAERLDVLCMEPAGDKGTTCNGPMVSALRSFQYQEDAVLRSCEGQVAGAQTGDELTGSDPGTVGCKRPAGDAAAAQRDSAAADEPHVYFVDSQQSRRERMHETRLRKASYVADPIEQGNAPKKAKTAMDGDKVNKPTPMPRGVRNSSRLSGMQR